MSRKAQQIAYSFGASLRQAREKRHYSREQIADRADISPHYLAALENDKRKPSLDILIRVIKATGASFDEVLAPQTAAEDEVTDRIKRLISQCSQRDQELVLSLIDQMLDLKEHLDKEK